MQFSEYQPLAEYENRYGALHEKNVKSHWDALVAESGIDEMANRATVEQINETQTKIDKNDSSLRTNKTMRGWLIFLIILTVCVSVFFLIKFRDPDSVHIVVIVLLLAMAVIIVTLYLIDSKLKPRMTSLTEVLAELNENKKKLTEEAWSQVAPLNALFTRHIPARLMEETYPLIDFDDCFDSKRFDYLQQKYKLGDNFDINQSTLFVKSGEIKGNPFCIFKTLNHYMGEMTYYGYKTIYWTEYYINSEGKRASRRVSETLSAKVTAPFPEYYETTYIIYGNEAAPNLVFKRKPSKANKMTDREIRRFVKRETKRIEKKMEKTVTQGENFTLMGNGEFESLFGALNRNNEVEFRLLFTPVAQREIVNLIKDKTVGFGDDFDFEKTCMLNTIRPEHINSLDITCDPKMYYHYDVAEIRRKFVEFNLLFFRSVYFAFAPLLAIPLYQSHKPHEFIYKDVYDSIVSCFEHERAANREASKFIHPRSVTRNILKTRHERSDGESDNVAVTAYGYRIEKKCTSVTVHGGDGKYHNVNVGWDKYISVQGSGNLYITMDDLLTQ